MEVVRRKLHLGPGLLWRVMDVLAYNPKLVPWASKDSTMAWDPDNDWELDEEDEPLDPDLAQRLNQAVRQPKWG